MSDPSVPRSSATYTDRHGSGSTPDLRGRVCVVTGATRGIGRATALQLAELGADVVLLGRDEKRLEEARAEARRLTSNQRVFWVRGDFASLDSVRAAAQEITDRWPSIHVLINNAGVNSAHRAVSADGHEMTFAVNQLAPFLFTSLLIPALERGARARIINVTSIFALLGSVNFDDLMMERSRYNSTRAYNQSKLAITMFTTELAARLEGSGISVNCVSPGLVATDLLREHWLFASRLMRPLWRFFLKSPERAAERVVHAATSRGLAGVTGQCFAGSDRPMFLPQRARDEIARQRLWDVSAELTGAPPLPDSGRGAR